MAENHETSVVRPDVDILEDIEHLFTKYPPLNHDRSRISISIADGVVTVSGHVRSIQMPQILEREATKVDGVKSVNLSNLYDDDTLRVKSGQATPLEVFTSVSYGAVMLNGSIPEGFALEDIVAKVEAIEGVRKVIPNFK